MHVGETEIQLAPKEFDLLWELLDHRGLVLTRDQLLERVWGYTFAGDTRTVDVHVRQIRRKLGDASPIVTVWGVGYKVATERTVSAERPARDASAVTAAPSYPSRMSGRCASACRPSSCSRSRSPGVLSAAIALRLFQNYTRGQSFEELQREAVGLTAIYTEAALRAAEEGNDAPDFVPPTSSARRATGSSTSARRSSPVRTPG